MRKNTNKIKQQVINNLKKKAKREAKAEKKKALFFMRLKINSVINQNKTNQVTKKNIITLKEIDKIENVSQDTIFYYIKYSSNKGNVCEFAGQLIPGQPLPEPIFQNQINY
ncbi:MAG: hypothetical protein PHT69_04430 [Bacteroidales bacterium]|nr:hypothetical protein [Bacteroidales bacterium]